MLFKLNQRTHAGGCPVHPRGYAFELVVEHDHRLHLQAVTCGFVTFTGQGLGRVTVRESPTQHALIRSERSKGLDVPARPTLQKLLLTVNAMHNQQVRQQQIDRRTVPAQYHLGEVDLGLLPIPPLLKSIT